MTLPPLPAPTGADTFGADYTAAQMESYARAAIAAHVPESELPAVIARCYAEFCGRDYMHLPLDEALRAALAAVPAGMALVPFKPTPAMRDAMRISSRRDYPSDELCNVRYAAMLAAAPKGQP